MHTAFYELCSLFVLCGIASRLYIPVALSYQHLDSEEDRTYHIVILRHFTVDLYSSCASQFVKELLVDCSSVASLTYATDFFVSHLFSPHLFQ